MSRVCFLVERGLPPRLNPVIAGAGELLESQDVQVSFRFPEEELLRIDHLRVEADLYLLKSDTELSLSLATALEQIGARVLNRARASILAKDKLVAAAILAQAGIPAPRSLAAAEPIQLASTVARNGPVILKPHRGYRGAGISVAERPSELPDAVAYPEVVFAQEYLASARRDLEVLAIGHEVFGVRKAFAPDGFLRGSEPTRLVPQVEDIARRCGTAFGLELYGLDIAEDPSQGPRVIDVNAFPGYRGVLWAGRRLADYVAGALRGS